MVRAYCRCNSGHYFVGDTCPLDGWSSPASQELSKTVEGIVLEGRELSLHELRRIGINESTLERTIIIEFGEDTSVFDAVSPEGYFVNGDWIDQRHFGRNFL